MEELLKQLRTYYYAFAKSKRKYKKTMTQDNFAQKCGWRPADISGAFRYLRGITTQSPYVWDLDNLKKFFDESCIVDSDGYLFFKDETQTGKDQAVNPIILHENYEKALIGEAIQEAGEAVCIINTYLATDMTHKELDESNPKTLRNWLFERKKKVRILILRPDGKGMMLRSKSLDDTGAELADILLRQLKMILKLQNELPTRNLPKENLQVKLIDEIPGVAAVILSNRLFYGLHLSSGHTELGAWCELTDTNHHSFKTIKKHFDTLWKDESRSTVLNRAALDHCKRALNIVRLEPDFLSNSKWKIYLHSMSDVTKGNGIRFENTIGKLSEWELEISEPTQGIYLMAKLTIPGSKESPETKLFTEKLITEKLADRDYAHVRFSDFTQLSVHLSFHCRLENRNEPFLLGYFIISAGGDSCSGYIVLRNITKLTAPYPPLPIYYRRLLSFRDSSYFSLQRTRSEKEIFMQKGMPYSGTYQVYSYGGKRGGGKCIKVNWLSINEYGEARYKNQNFDSFIGRATYIGQYLHFVFTHVKPKERPRRSYLIISLADSEGPKEGTFYSGVHLGVSENPSMPIGKRFILEYKKDANFQKVKPAIIPLHSPEYQAMSKELRKLLSGRIKNLLGFLREEGNIVDFMDIKKEWEGSIKMSEVFYDSAIQKASTGEYPAAGKMILRAVNHGFDNIPAFEAAVGADALAQIRETTDYKVVEEIFRQEETAGIVEFHV